jgi:hypothetical protein
VTAQQCAKPWQAIRCWCAVSITARRVIRIGLVPDDLAAVRLRETLRLVLPRPA